MKKQLGATALEFLFLFPLVVSLVYAAGVYGVLFSWQVKMQIAVDRATASVMYLDRSATNTPQTEAEALANQNMADLAPDFVGAITDACSADEEIVTCTLSVTLKDSGCAGEGGATSTMTGPDALGFLGGFPPMPDCLKAVAKVAY